MGQQGAEQEVLGTGQGIGGLARQAQQPVHRALHPLGQRLGIVPDRGAGGGQRPQHVQRLPRRRAGREHHHLPGGVQPPHPLRGLAPRRQPLAPGRRGRFGRLGRRRSAPLRRDRVDPRLQIGAAGLGERQRQVRQVPLRVDRDHRNPVQRGLLEQTDAQAGLAATGHADDHRVRGQVGGVQQDRSLGVVAVRPRLAAQEELAHALWKTRVAHGRHRTRRPLRVPCAAPPQPLRSRHAGRRTGPVLPCRTMKNACCRRARTTGSRGPR